MSDETLGQVATLLEDALVSHKNVNHVVLCTKEGVVVASVSKKDEVDPRIISTVSAALIWAGSTTMEHIDSDLPTHVLHSTQDEDTLTVIRPNYHLVVILSSKGKELNIKELVPALHSVLTRIELVILASKNIGQETILSRLVKNVPQIKQAMILTLDGLPVGVIGFENHIELAALTSSIFANGLTLSLETENIQIGSIKKQLMITRIDETRLLVVVCDEPKSVDICRKVKEFIAKGI